MGLVNSADQILLLCTVATEPVVLGVQIDRTRHALAHAQIFSE